MLLAIPFIMNVYLYIVTEGIYGFFTGVIDCASNAWIMELWPEYSSPFMQALHFFFAIGMVVSPLIDEPFLTPINSTNGTDTDFMSMNEYNEIKVDLIPGASNLLIPFLIGSAGFFIVGICQIILRCYIKYDIPSGDQVKKRTISAASSASQTTITRSKNYKLIVTILAMLLFISYASTEMNSFTFIAEFAVYCDLRLSKSIGAFMSSVMAASFAFSRGLSAFVATKISPKIMLYTSVGMIAVGNVLLITFGNTSVTGLWIAIVILGSGHSSIIGNLYSFLEERIDMTSLICGCCMFSCCVGSIVSPIIVGSFLKQHPSVFGFINVGGLAVVLLILTSFKLVDRIFTKPNSAAVTTHDQANNNHVVS
jgi:MFS family permease